jgi:hypothetical protein
VAGEKVAGLRNSDHVYVRSSAKPQVPPTQAAGIEVEVDDERPPGSHAVAHPLEGRRAQRRLGVEQKPECGDQVRRVGDQSGRDGDVAMDDPGVRAAPSSNPDHCCADIDAHDAPGALGEETEHSPRPAGEVDRRSWSGPARQQLIEDALFELPLDALGGARIEQVAIETHDLDRVDMRVAIRAAEGFGHWPSHPWGRGAALSPNRCRRAIDRTAGGPDSRPWQAVARRLV